MLCNCNRIASFEILKCLSWIPVGVTSLKYRVVETESSVSTITPDTDWHLTFIHNRLIKHWIPLPKHIITIGLNADNVCPITLYNIKLDIVCRESSELLVERKYIMRMGILIWASAISMIFTQLLLFLALQDFNLTLPLLKKSSQHAKNETISAISEWANIMTCISWAMYPYIPASWK